MRPTRITSPNLTGAHDRRVDRVRDGVRPMPGPRTGVSMIGTGEARVREAASGCADLLRRARSRLGGIPRRWADRATRGAAWMALLVSLALTVAAWRFADAREQQAARLELEGRVAALASRLSTRILAYEQLLRGGAGLFATGGTVSRAEWGAFVGALGLASLPGIEGMGWAPKVPAGELGTHVDAARRGGVSDYRVFPLGGQNVFGPVAYLEPMSGRNLRALGFDMFGEPVRRQAMQQARDTGRTSLTGRVVLVQEGAQPQQAGFLAYQPVYRADAHVGTVDERRTALLGWVYGAFRAADFVGGALGDSGGLRYRIQDGRDGALLYAGGGSRESADADPAALRVPVAMIDREWELVAWPDAPGPGAAPRGSTILAVGGTFGSLLIFGIVWSVATTRRRALAIADRMTAALREANEMLETRVRERTGSPQQTNERLAAVNEKLRAVNAAFGTFGAGGPAAERLDRVAGQLRPRCPRRSARAGIVPPSTRTARASRRRRAPERRARGCRRRCSTHAAARAATCCSGASGAPSRPRMPRCCRSSRCWWAPPCRCTRRSRASVAHARRPSAPIGPRTRCSRSCRTSCARRSTRSRAGCTCCAAGAPTTRRCSGARSR
jgi:CHASE1-domain containing sensor protein